MKKTLFAVAVLAIGCGLAAAPAVADQLYVCTGCVSPPGGDPNLINAASINIGFAGNHSAVSPLLLVVGVPDGGTAPTLSLPSGVGLASAGTYYGANVNGSLMGELDGTLTSSSSNVYAAVGLMTGAGGGASESWTNWEGFETANNVNVGSGFNLYVYGIDDAMGSSPIDIGFSGLGMGSFVVAYACASPEAPQCKGGAIGETPFTNAGASMSTSSVPEPASLALLGTALLGLCILLSRRSSRRAAPAERAF